MRDQNYYNTFIEIADDCRATVSKIPSGDNQKITIASLQFYLMRGNPYKYTQEDILFEVYAIRKNINPGDRISERENFFSKGQPCLRSSPLGKQYGWGIHCNDQGKVAIYPVESEDYKKLAEDKKIKHIKAMRSKRA